MKKIHKGKTSYSWAWGLSRALIGRAGVGGFWIGAYFFQRFLLVVLAGGILPLKRPFIESVVDLGFGGPYGYLGPWIHLPLLVAAVSWFVLAYYLLMFYFPVFRKLGNAPPKTKRFWVYWRTSGWFGRYFVEIVSAGFLLPFAILAGAALSVQTL